jgi:type I restriction enzyme S subunit
MASGANLPRISPSLLSDFEIPLPPPDEQRRIAEILDRADALRRKSTKGEARLGALVEADYFATFGPREQAAWPNVAIEDVCTMVRTGPF